MCDPELVHQHRQILHLLHDQLESPLLYGVCGHSIPSIVRADRDANNDGHHLTHKPVMRYQVEWWMFLWGARYGIGCYLKPYEYHTVVMDASKHVYLYTYEQVEDHQGRQKHYQVSVTHS